MPEQDGDPPIQNDASPSARWRIRIVQASEFPPLRFMWAWFGKQEF